MWSTEDWSYLVGAFHGDGFARQRKPGNIGSSELVFTVGCKDSDYADVLTNLLGKYSIRKDKDTLRVCAYGEIASKFVNLKHKGIWNLSYPPFHVNSWLAGLYDTDGGFYGDKRRQRIEFFQKNNGNVGYVANVLEFLGINYKLALRKERISIKGIRSSASSDLRITSVADIINFSKLITLRHPRKAKKLIEMVAIAQERKDMPKRISDSELLTKIKDVKEQKVDISISKMRYLLRASCPRIQRVLEEDSNAI